MTSVTCLLTLILVVTTNTCIGRGETDINTLDFQQQIEQQNRKIEDLEKKLSVVLDMVSEKRLAFQSSIPVTFTAFMTSSIEIIEPATVVLPFDDAPTNIGGHFDTATHKFTCPVDGIYMFTFSLHTGGIGGTNDQYQSRAELVMDGVGLARVATINDNPSGWMSAQGNHAVTAYCSYGQQVWLQTVGGYGYNKIFGSNSLHSAFSGILLQLYAP